MATVETGVGIDMINLQTTYGTVTEATPTRLVIDDGVYQGVYVGVGFQYSTSHVVAGTMTGFQGFYKGSLIFSATGVSIPAPVAEYYVQNNNIPGLLSIALAGNDTIVGSVYNRDILAGYGGNDHIKGNGSYDYIDGGDGIDTAIFLAPRIAYKIGYVNGALQIGRVDGQEASDVVNVERLSFQDVTVALDKQAAQAYRLYQAAFDRTPDRDGLSFWVGQMDHGRSLKDAAASFISSQEFSSKYGFGTNDLQFVSALYSNVLDRLPDSDGYGYWLGALGGGMARSDALISFSESVENVLKTSAATESGVTLNVDHTIWG